MIIHSTLTRVNRHTRSRVFPPKGAGDAVTGPPCEHSMKVANRTYHSPLGWGGRPGHHQKNSLTLGPGGLMFAAANAVGRLALQRTRM